MTDACYIIGGTVCLVLGTWIIVAQIRTFRKGKQDKLGFTIQLLAGGIMAVMLGIAMILKHV